MKLNNRFIFGILSLVLAAVIAFVALPTIARQTKDVYKRQDPERSNIILRLKNLALFFCGISIKYRFNFKWSKGFADSERGAFYFHISETL